MSAIEVTTQAQLDKALAKLKDGDWIVCLGGIWNNPLVVYGSAPVEASGSATVEASGSATVRAYGSATVRASGSATVWASGSATVRASGSATVRASGSATVRAYGSATVRASQCVAVHRMPCGAPKITGGVILDVPDPATLDARDWCDYYGVEVSRGYASLFKAVDDDWSTPRARAAGIFYTVGAKIVAPDWKPTAACGNGLHASPRPMLARGYNDAATRYVQVKAKVADIVVIDNKVKVPALTVVCECDLNGDPVGVAA